METAPAIGMAFHFSTVYHLIVMKKSLFIALLAVLPLTVSAKVSAPAAHTAPNAATADATAESVAENLCKLMDDCASLMERCQKKNADKTADKLEKKFAQVKKQRSGLKKIVKKHPEQMEELKQNAALGEKLEKALQRLDAAHEQLAAKEFYGSPRLEKIAEAPCDIAFLRSAAPQPSSPKSGTASVSELMTECAALMNACTQENADAQTDKLEALFDKIQEAITAGNIDENADKAAAQMEAAAKKLEANGYYGSSRLETLLTHPHRKQVETQDLNTASPEAIATECAGRLEEMADLLEQCTQTNADETADKLTQKIARLTELKKAAERLTEEARAGIRTTQQPGESLLVADLRFEAAAAFVKEKGYFGSEKLKQTMENLPR